MNLEGEKMNREFDVVIIGTGLAGLYCALNLRGDLNILLITKTKINECNTYLAQGGITTILNENDKELFIEDTLKAGMYKNNRKMVEVVANEARENIDILQKLGVKFDKKNNEFDYTSEGGHSKRRIVHCADKTGQQVFESVLSKVTSKRNITIYENTSLVDIIEENYICKGIIVIKDGEVKSIYGKKIVLATGGIGGLFKKTTNQKTLEGIATAIAIRHYIEIKDTEFIQYHPTGFFNPESKEKCFLISESLRGEGAKLINIRGERFVNELLPRNIVTKAIFEEQIATNSDFEYLDISFKDEGYIKKRFPLIYKECKERGIDITKEPIPITPVQHYSMGGVLVNADSQTTMENLYACGECCCTGLHGENRMASNSLLEALVFSRRAAKHINKVINKKDVYKKNKDYNINNRKIELLNKKNKEIVLEHIKKVRGDLINELVTY